MGADTSKVKGSSSAIKRADMQSLSCFSPKYIMKLHERFQSGSEDFNLTRQGLKDFFKCSDRECDVLFDIFDKDGNKHIDNYEFVCALTLMAHGNLDDKAELIFKLYDFDRSMSISKDELTILMTNALTAMKAMEGKPAPSMQEIQKKTNEFFVGADTNNDQQISLKEFKTYIKKDKQILECLCSFGLAKRDDMGKNYAASENDVPHLDDDLDAECNPVGRAKVSEDVVQNDDDDDDEGNDFFAMADVGEADQMLCVKPFEGVIRNSVPSGYKKSKKDGMMPEAELELDYVFGYRAHDARNNLRYNADGHLVYHAAGVGIVMDQKKNTQKHFLGHQDDIMCMAIDPSGVLVATGEIGPKPRLCVWNSQTMETVAIINSQLTKGIMKVCWSPDGRYVAACDQHSDHNVCIFDMKAKDKKTGATGVPIVFGKGDRASILSIGFNAKGDGIYITCVRKQVYLTWQNGTIKAKNCSGWGQPESVLCQATVGQVTFTGCITGEIFSWNGPSFMKRFKAHEGKVDALYACKNGTGLLSGGADGLVKYWKVSGGTLSDPKEYDLKDPQIMSMNPAVRSVADNKDGTKILVGTRGSEIVEFDEKKNKPVLYLRSHFDQELWGLAPHPTKPEVFTFSQDCMLGVWDLITRRQTRHCKLACGGDALAFSNKGDLLVLGFLNGQILVLDNDFNSITKRCDKRQDHPISCIKFNPQDTICAVGANDSMIFTYDVTKKFRPMKKLKGHHSRILHMDWSEDGNVLQSSCTSYEILFWDVYAGKQNTHGASAYKDEHWQTWTLPIGWPVQGVQYTVDYTDVNAVERSPDDNVIATCNDDGFVKLYTYPCPLDPLKEKVASKPFYGHSSHVTNCTFTRNKDGQKYLVTTGGNDKCVFSWKYFMDTEAQEEAKLALEAPQESEGNEFFGAPADMEGGDAFDFEVTEQVADQHLSVLPFKGQVENSYPSTHKKNKADSKMPEANLSLKWAHGFRSWDTYGNLKYANDGNVVFTTAGLGVVQNIAGTKQNFSNLHKEDIVSMAMHPDGDIVATGQEAGKDLNEAVTQKKNQGGASKIAAKQGKLVDIHIWKASDPTQKICTLKGIHRRAVRQLAFSPDGSKLLSIGCDDKYTAVVYDWRTKNAIAQVYVNDVPINCSWKDNGAFATCGVKHLQQYQITGNTIKSQRGSYISKVSGRKTQMTGVCYVFDGKQLVSGVANGQILKWSGSSCQKPIKAHDAAIFTIVDGKDGQNFWSGGDCGTLIKWNAQFKQVITIDLKAMIPMEPGVRSLDIKKDGTLLIGTYGAKVVEVDPNQPNQIKNTITQGHFREKKLKIPEVWGCSVHPSKSLFCSSGGDRTIRIWSDRAAVKVSDQFPEDITALDWCKANDGKWIVAGDRVGGIHCIDADTLEVVGQAKCKLPGWIEEIKFSPCGTMIACGTHKGVSPITICTVDQNTGKIKKKGDFNCGISSALYHFDWTQDSQYIAINSQAYELYWFDVQGGNAKVNASSTKDFQYDTFTCLFGYPVQGIWQSADYTDTNYVDRSRNEQFLATGGDDGMVRLFKYPCYWEKSQNKEFSGHSSHVTKVKFSNKDQYMVSTGGKDLTVLVWETDWGQPNAEEPIQDDPLPEDYNSEVEEQYDDNDDDDEWNFDLDDDPLDEGLVYVDRGAAAAKKKEAQKQQNKSQGNMGSGQDQQDDDENDMFAYQQEVGDQFAAVKPWIGSIRPPDSAPKKYPAEQYKAPKVTVDLDWVYGYRGSMSRNGLAYLENGSLCYYNAGVGVVYDPNQKTQEHFIMHTDDITCIAFHPDGKTVATGETGKAPVVNKWDANATSSLKKYKRQGIVRTVQCVAFSPDGSKLVVIDASNDHNMVVYDTASDAVILKKKGTKDPVRDCAWQDEDSFVTTGPKHFCLWTIEGGNFKSKNGVFGKNDRMHIGCVFNGSNCLTGSAKGELYVWNSNNLTKAHKLHSRVLEAICVTDSVIFTGARDGKINALKKDYSNLWSVDCHNILTDSMAPWPRAFALNQSQDTLMVGTYGHEIYEVPIDLKSGPVKNRPAIQHIAGHFEPMKKSNNEIWGLTTFNNVEKSISTGDDCTLRIWDTMSHRQLAVIRTDLDIKGQRLPPNKATGELNLGGMGRCVSINHTDNMVAVGMNDGSVRLYKLAGQQLQLLAIKPVSKRSMVDIKFSPNGEFIACACSDAAVYILNADKKMETFVKLKKSSSTVNHLDWSEDSAWIRTNDSSYELMFYDVQGKQQMTNGASVTCNENWASGTCTLTWGTQGIWQPGMDGTDINAVDRSRDPIVEDYHLQASATDNSGIEVFRYPSNKEAAKPVKVIGHTSHVTNVRFTRNNTLMSTGGNDSSVMQWSFKQE